MSNQLQFTPTAAQETALATPQCNPLYVMAQRLNVNGDELAEILRGTVFQKASDAEFAALLLVANEYQLNPLLREIYAFPKKGGGIVPVVGVDGWIKIGNRSPKLAGPPRFAFEEREGYVVEKRDRDGTIFRACTGVYSCTCTIRLKDCEDPMELTEYLEECFRATEPWQQHTRRLLRHKTLIQTLRYAIGISGIFDEDEAADVVANAKPAQAREVTETRSDLRALAESAPVEKVVWEGRMKEPVAVEQPTPAESATVKQAASQPVPDADQSPFDEPKAPAAAPAPDAKARVLAKAKEAKILNKIFYLAVRGCRKIDGILGLSQVVEWPDAVYDQIEAHWDAVVKAAREIAGSIDRPNLALVKGKLEEIGKKPADLMTVLHSRKVAEHAGQIEKLCEDELADVLDEWNDLFPVSLAKLQSTVAQAVRDAGVAWKAFEAVCRAEFTGTDGDAPEWPRDVFTQIVDALPALIAKAKTGGRPRLAEVKANLDRISRVGSHLLMVLRDSKFFPVVPASLDELTEEQCGEVLAEWVDLEPVLTR